MWESANIYKNKTEIKYICRHPWEKKTITIALNKKLSNSTQDLKYKYFKITYN